MITSYARQYEQTQVTTSSGVQLIVLLYDGAIQSMEIARQEIQVKNIQGKARHLGRALLPSSVNSIAYSTLNREEKLRGHCDGCTITC